MSLLLARLPVLGLSAAATAAALYYFYGESSKKARSAKDKEQGEPRRGECQLIDAIVETDEFNEVIRWMPATSAVRLSRCSRVLNERISDPATAAWCAESRRTLLEAQSRAGDLTLGSEGVRWTLERLHLCENPPRFPRIYFDFASDEISFVAVQKLERVAALLRRHPKLRLVVHGFAQPDAPGPIGEALAQARATSVRERLLLLLATSSEFADEHPHEGVRALRDSSPWFTQPGMHPYNGLTRLVGTKIQAVGRWRQQPHNRNFESLFAGPDEDGSSGDDDEVAPPQNTLDESGSDDNLPEEDDYESDDEASRLRRAEFTLLGLDSGPL